jgi:hypothetical protein
MQNIRRNLAAHAEEAVKNARTKFDWRHYVASHPWTAVAAAAAVGFLLVPRRACGKASSPPATSATVAPVARTSHSPLSGVAAGILTGVMGAVTSTIAGEAAALVARSFNEVLKPRGQSSGSGPAEKSS